jgi:ribose transport system ATP-binding protein
MAGIRKSFGGTVALDGVDLSVAPGEVHALVGENGAGKSTLMKVLSGAIRPDGGRMVLDGEPYEPSEPEDARRRGVAMIYQELNLAPHLSVLDNVMLGIEETRFGFLSRRSMETRVREALALLHHPDISPQVPVRRLSISAQQLVEVARALVSSARTIVFDEPTSSLTRRDTSHLFEVIRRLRGRGVSVVYISHFLEEVREISDRFTVLRDGRTAGAGEIAATPLGRIVELMVGRSVSEMFPRVPHEPGEPVLEARELAGATRPKGASFSLRRGEILGIFGLVGAGRTETLRVIFGLDRVRSGKVESLRWGEITGISPRRAIRLGLGLLSENRKEEGILLNRCLAENAALSDYPRMAILGWIPPRREREAARRLMGELAIKARGPEARAASLSGGNQQKVAIARLIQQKAEVFLLDEPTRGIDVGSKVQIYQLMGRLAAEGKSILFVSSYLPELLGVADRIAVMSRGVVTAVRTAQEWTEESIMLEATRGV